MFTRPFVLDSTQSEELLGLTPTPLDVAAKETVDWWRSENCRTSRWKGSSRPIAL